MKTTDPVPLQREDNVANAGAEARRKILERAKANAEKGGSRPGPMEGVPRFDEVDRESKTMKPAPGHATPPPGLSRTTLDALNAVAAANVGRADVPPEVAPEAEPATAEPLTRETIAILLDISKEQASEVLAIVRPGDSISTRKRIEARLSPIDIGEFLMSSHATQAVPLIPPTESLRKGLTITYQSVTEAVEAAVDRRLSTEAASIRKERDGTGFIDVEMSQREYVRRQNEYALAVHVQAYGDQRWPVLLTAAGAVDEGNLDLRMAKVRQIPAAIFAMAIQNLAWFLDRVQRTLEVAVLGNG
jgi:hypothetical protein